MVSHTNSNLLIIGNVGFYVGLICPCVLIIGAVVVYFVVMC